VISLCAASSPEYAPLTEKLAAALSSKKGPTVLIWKNTVALFLAIIRKCYRTVLYEEATLTYLSNLMCRKQSGISIKRHFQTFSCIKCRSAQPLHGWVELRPRMGGLQSSKPVAG
jgi:hypothetical protein